MFVRYAKARASRDEEEHLYRVYVTETVRNLAQGKVTAISYEELLRQARKGVKAIDGDRIAADVIGRAGLNVV